MADWPLTLAVGAMSGLLAGMFGIGGGLLTTPAIRVVLGYPAFIAVGTPLVAILPTAVFGAVSYARAGMADVRLGLTVGAWGIVGSVAGAALTRLAGGSTLMLLTAVLVLFAAADMAWSARAAGAAQPPAPPEAPLAPPRAGRVAKALTGLVTGLYSGFFGLGGGFVLVPLLTRRMGLSIKQAIGTSLVAIGVLAVPGIATHWALGNVDVRLGVLLALGSVPGALAGARVTRMATERWVRIGFAALMSVVGVILALTEIRAMA